MRLKSFLFLLHFLVCFFAYGQSENEEVYRIMFYNVENLFDTIDNPLTNDEEFLPEGNKEWNNYRYWRKIKKTFQVIAAAGDETPPDIIGFCEVEDFLTLYHITNNTPLSKYPYSIIHQNSPDKRGIDVGLIIRNDRVKVLSKQFLAVEFPWDTLATTREVLQASLLIKTDTLHIFVNHWPSRRGGQVKSEPRRLVASKVVSNAIDLILVENPDAKIIIMGDFNDEPKNKSVQSIQEEHPFVNLSESMAENCRCGTYKYRSAWNMLDQMLVSESLFIQQRLSVNANSLQIVDNNFLFKEDASYGGKKPFRTYLGPRYIGGYSDHLPIVLQIKYSE